mmetsp:Transcript_5062/g.7833  ORF Transcript_5062/g.7833 Transcript_5062/m.7833 type:complete len:210 (+) Transcript_5062:151-780(+)
MYRGDTRIHLVVKDNVLQRYRAAFRGGGALSIGMKAFLSSASLLLRVRLPVCVTLFCFLFHIRLPRPAQRDFSVVVRKGWKHGTKVTFRDVANPSADVSVKFVLQEQKHRRYTRLGNNLMTQITIKEITAKSGGLILIDSIVDGEPPIKFRLEPQVVKENGQVIRIPGRGWPLRNGNGHGDLLVKVFLLPNKHKKRTRRNKKRNNKNKL